MVRFQRILFEVLRIIDLVFLAAGGWTRRVAAAAYTRSALSLSTSHIHILNKMPGSSSDSPVGRQGLMVVHLAKLMKEGVIEERAYELALKQFFDNTPGGVSNASPPELNNVGKASSHRPMSTPLCRGFVHKGVEMKGNITPIPSSFVPS